MPAKITASEAGNAVNQINQARRWAAMPEHQASRPLYRAADGIAGRMIERGPGALRPRWLDQELDAAGYRWRLRYFAHGVNHPDAQSFIQSLKNGASSRDILTSPVALDLGISYRKTDSRLRQQGIHGIWVAVAALPDKPAPHGWRKAVLAHVNRFRRQFALPPLTLNRKLNRAAQAHADDMAVKDYFDHISPNNSQPGERAANFGYKYRLVLENLAAGMRQPKAVVEGWKASKDGHREAMLNPAPVDVGIGYRYHPTDKGRARYFHYWAMTMGQPRK